MIINPPQRSWDWRLGPPSHVLILTFIGGEDIQAASKLSGNAEHSRNGSMHVSVNACISQNALVSMALWTCFGEYRLVNNVFVSASQWSCINLWAFLSEHVSVNMFLATYNSTYLNEHVLLTPSGIVTKSRMVELLMNLYAKRRYRIN